MAMKDWILQIGYLILCLTAQVLVEGYSDRMLLTDVKVLTLHHGKYTEHQRSSAVPQLQCVGGSAMGKFVPQVIQCYNRGWDGYDVQWECKTDMDNRYRFGKIEVSCEGYDYPEDPYILRGSCGLQYTLDWTEEGEQKPHYSYGHDSRHKYYDYDYHDRSGYHHSYRHYKEKAGSIIGDLVTLGIIAGIIYCIYKTCIASGGEGQTYSRDQDTQQGERPPPYSQQENQPPPYGWGQKYYPNDGSSCRSNQQSYSAGGFTNSTGGYTNTAPASGWWSGAFTGGLMGYLFGSRNRGYDNGYGSHNYAQRYSRWGSNSWRSPWSWGSGSSWGTPRQSYSSRSYSPPSSSSSSFSSGTRTASGFGGTKRR